METIVGKMPEEEWQGTNLIFIEKYFNAVKRENIEIVPLKYWVNCNTREDIHIFYPYRPPSICFLSYPTWYICREKMQFLSVCLSVPHTCEFPSDFYGSEPSKHHCFSHIPVPYYDKGEDGKLEEMHYEGESFPEEVPVLEIRNIHHDRSPFFEMIHKKCRMNAGNFIIFIIGIVNIYN